MSTRRALTRPEPTETWDFSANCNDCRAELQGVLDELVELGALEPGWGPLGGPCHPHRYHNVRPSRWEKEATR